MSRIRSLVLFLLPFVIFGSLIADIRRLDPESVFRVIECEVESGYRSRYALYAPVSRNPNEPLPLVVFLHGTGEVGTDGKKQLKTGLAPFLYDSVVNEGRWPRFVALFPQAQELADWSVGSTEASLLMEYIEDVRSRYPVDLDRIYLCGHSVGGNGVWSLAARYPDRWAAIVPICGWSEPNDAPVIARLPAWVFQGAQDEAGLVTNVREMVRSLKQAGGQPKYTEFTKEGHFVSHHVFDAELFDWLLSQTRAGRGKAPRRRHGGVGKRKSRSIEWTGTS